MKLFIVLAAVCIVAVHSIPLFDRKDERNYAHQAAADSFCVAANALKSAGWMENNGKMSRKFRESEEAKECQDIHGDNACDTADKIMSCMSHRGLITAAKIATLPISMLGHHH